MPKHEKVTGYEEFRDTVTELSAKSGGQINIYFTGEKDDNGSSWCPDCNDAEPLVFQAFKEHAEEESIFLEVNVGGRTFWKDLHNPFRQDCNIRLSVIPTLLRWQSVCRLDGEQCAKSNLLEMFFSENSEE